MPNLPAQTVVAECPCSACGKPVKVKLNKNGMAYYYCHWSLDTGDTCSHHQKWGKAHSQELQRRYLASKEQHRDIEHVTTSEITAPATDIQEQPTSAHGAPESATRATEGGFLAEYL